MNNKFSISLKTWKTFLNETWAKSILRIILGQKWFLMTMTGNEWMILFYVTFKKFCKIYRFLFLVLSLFLSFRFYLPSHSWIDHIVLILCLKSYLMRPDKQYTSVTGECRREKDEKKRRRTLHLVEIIMFDVF